MMNVQYSIQLGEALSHQIEAMCPHCETQSSLHQHRLLGKIQSMPLNSIVLVCSNCQKVSRQENAIKRLISAIVTVPFLIVLIAGFVAGAYFLGAMLVGDGVFSVGFFIIATVLLVACSFLLFRLGKFLWKIMLGSDLIPLVNLQTQI